MSSLVVGGVVIPVAVSSPTWSRSDAVDRGRVFDHTSFVSQTGGAARAWSFTTPPVAVGLYEGVLGTVAAQLCSGDILVLPTMCHVEFMGGKPVRAQGTKVTLDFVLHEVQPAKTLLRYAPGDTIAGESFSRATTATYINAVGAVSSAAINVKRDSHYIGGVRTLLLEAARTNLLPRSAEFDHAAWVKDGGISVAANVAVAPDGFTSMDRMTRAAGSLGSWAQLAQAVSRAATQTAYTASCWVQAEAGTVAGSIAVSDTAFKTETQAFVATTTATRITFTTTAVWDVAGTLIGLGINLNANGTVLLWGAQLEVAPFVSSYIPTEAAAVPRATDLWSLPFTTPPQEMSAYVKFVESGTFLLGNPTALLLVGSAVATEPLFLMEVGGSNYITYHGEGAAGAVSSGSGTGPTIGQTAEMVGNLYGDGSIQSSYSINGAATTQSTQSAALALSTAWNAALAHPNTYNSAQGFVAFRSIKVLAGARSLAEMRAL